MKTIRDFLRKHALLLLAALVVLSVPTGVALGKYVGSVTVTSGLKLDVSMVTVEYTIYKNEMWKVISRLPKGSTTLKFVKGNDEALKGLEELSKSGIQDDSLESGKIGVYQSNDGTTIYIAPMDGSRNVMYAPVDSNSLLSAALGLSDSLKTISFDNLDTSRVTNMGGMFQNCHALTSLNLEGLDTSNVTSMASMFYGCESLTTLDLSSLITSKVTTMNSMFYDCKSLTSLNLSNLDTSNVAFTVNSLGDEVGGMNYMFGNCSALTELDLSSFNTSNVTGMTDMFWGCKNLERIYVGRRFVTDKVTEPASDVFHSCEKLKGEKGTKCEWGKFGLKYARIDGGTSAPGYFWSAIGTQSLTNSVNVNVDSAYGFGVDHAA